MEERRREESLYEDEIDLYDLWLRLKRRWKVILGTLILCLTASGVYILTAKPVYEGRFIIKPRQDPTIENINEPVPILTSRELVESIKNLSPRTPDVRTVSPKLIREAESVEVTVEVYRPEAVREVYKEIIDKLENLPYVKERLNTVKALLSSEREELIRTLNRLEEMTRIFDRSGRPYFNIYSDIAEIKIRLKEIESELKNIKAFDTLLPPKIPDRPSKPKKALILGVSFVSALFLGIFLALFLEWLEKARRRHQT